MSGRVRLGDLEEVVASGGAKGFRASVGGREVDLFVVLHAGGVYGYLNRCPHTGAPLDWLPDRFLTTDRSLIQCANHDALFRIHDGTCIRGPCAGRALTSVRVALRGGVLFLEPIQAPRRRPADAPGGR